MTKSGKTVVIADDHALVRNGLRDILESLDEVEVVGEAENGIEAISLGKHFRPSLMTLDAGMPLCKGMEVYGEIRRWSPDTKIAVVTGFTAVGSLADWIAAGVDGLFLKSCAPEEMKTGFDLILRGGGYVEKQILSLLEETPEDEALTPRERQILHLVAEGNSNAEIAERLSISPKTVDNHRTRLMSKLNVHSVAQLLAHALKEGLLDSASQS
ncbi:MAG: response regulator transcription factor [Stappiaceae bacterium]